VNPTYYYVEGFVLTRYRGPRGAAMTSRWDEMMELVIPNEKGALLYQEPGRRWVQILIYLALSAGLFATGLLFALPIWGFWGDLDMGWGMDVLCLGLASMFIALSVVVTLLAFKSMPFKIYEGGVTLPVVPLRDGLDGREVFVPSTEISKVTYESTYVSKVGVVHYFRFHRVDGEDFNVSAKDPREVTHLLFQVLRCEVEGPG
jgi:hypothetical protein